MVGAVYGYQRLKQDEATKEANPNSPWLWRSDWTTNRALSRKPQFHLWLVDRDRPGEHDCGADREHESSTLVAQFRSEGVHPDWLWPDSARILLVGAVRATLRRELYGNTYFEFSSLPFSPGKRAAGQIHLRLNTSASHGIDLRLSCIRRIVTGSGKEQSTNEIVLWQDQKNVPQTALCVGPIGTAIPVDFGIPQDAYETNHDESRDQLLWVLHAQADVPGIDYSDDFEIPVFRSGPKTAQAENPGAYFTSGFASSLGSSAAAGTAPAFESDSTEVSAPANPKVVISTASDGSTEFYFPGFRNRNQTFGLFLFTAVWTGVVYFLAHSRAPWFFALVFGLFDLLLIYGCFQNAFGITRIVVGNGKITCLQKIFGSGTRREIPFSDVQTVVAGMGIQNTNATNGVYRVRLQTKGGKNFSLVDNIADRQEARWVVSQIEKLAGLKTDTHVALQDALWSRLRAPATASNFRSDSHTERPPSQ